MSAAPDISLPRFEGPLDLLLELVRKHELEITEIPIAEITRQYLEYMERADKLDIDLGAEFAYIASLLIHIKSRTLLSSDPELAAREEDPRQELVRLLIDHRQLRESAEFLMQKLEVAQATWSNPPAPEFRASDNPPAPGGAMNLLEVLRRAQEALETARAYAVIFPRESVTVEEMERWLENRLSDIPEEWTLEKAFEEQPTPDHRAAVFLALLEMANRGLVSLEQPEPFAPVRIIALDLKPHKRAATSGTR